MERSFCIEQFFKSNSIIKVQCDFHNRFKLPLWKYVPNQKTIQRWVRRFWMTASTGNVMCPGKPRTVRTIENIDRVCATFHHSPTCTARWHAEFWKHFYGEYRLYSYRRFRLPSLKVDNNTTMAGFGLWESKTFCGDRVTETGLSGNQIHCRMAP